MMPKHRQTIFVVVRIQYADHEGAGLRIATCCESYRNLESAEEAKGCMEQEFKDRGLFDYFEFEVQTVTYYDD